MKSAFVGWGLIGLNVVILRVSLLQKNKNENISELQYYTEWRS